MPLELPTKLRKTGGLWQRTSGRGHVYFAGGNREQKFYMFKNPDAGKGQPEWSFYVEDREPLNGAAIVEQEKPRRRASRKRSPQKQKLPCEQKPFDDPLDDLFGG